MFAMRHVDPRYFLIALLPILVFAIDAFITGHLFPQDLNIPLAILRIDQPWLEAAGRYRFVAATWFFAALVALAVAMLVHDLRRPLTNASRAAAIATMLVILVLAVSPSIQFLLDPDKPRIYGRIGIAFFETALGNGSLPNCNGPDDVWVLGPCGPIPVITLFNRVIDLINILAGLGVGALIVGMVLCLERLPTKSTKDAAKTLAANLQRMRRQLYLSGLVLTFGLLFATSWMHWPSALVVDDSRDAFLRVVKSASLYMGVYFSLLILSFYLPVALILDRQVQDLSEHAREDVGKGAAFNVTDWRAQNSLKEGVADYIRAGLALTAPILAAFAGGIAPIST